MANELIGTTPIWWELQNLPDQLITELRRRNNNNNLGFDIENTGGSFDFVGNKNYKGPLVPWIRIFSNGTGKPTNYLVPSSKYLKSDGYNGFILKGGDGFYDAFGYEQNVPLSKAKAIIGYEANGTTAHTLNSDRTNFQYSVKNDDNFPQNNITSPILPPPGVTSMNIKQGRDFFVTADVKFNCYGLAQLEYMMPFFLTPGINIFLEFGYNYFNKQSLLDLSNKTECVNNVLNPQIVIDRALKSNGNYGCITGIITNYNFSTTNGFAYECSFEIKSRQGLYAGMKVDTVTSNSDGDIITSLRTLIKTYIPEVKNVVKNKKNFYKYIEELEDTENRPPPLPSGVKFYDDKPEDRIFIGRQNDIYNKKKSPSESPSKKNGPPIIEYKKINDDPQYSYACDTDFDFESTDETWLQLGFVFELFNTIMTIENNSTFRIDIEDIVINAHPNLISCDKNVLIPNPVSPKINKGIQGEDFSSMMPDQTFRRNELTDSQKKFNESPDNFNEKDGLVLSSYIIATIFKTRGQGYRDNIDTLINYLYYNSSNNNKEGSAAFPWSSVPDELIKNKNYKPYYYGYLKNILINSSKLIDVVTDENIKNYRDLISNLLNVINESVDNFWKFDIVERVDGEGLSIVDKNTMSNLDEIYMFEMGSGNNCIRNINFDVSLTNDQSINVYFGGQGGQNVNSKSSVQSNSTTQPAVKFADRLTEELLKKVENSNSNSNNTSNSSKIDPSIVTIQKRNTDKSVLMMTVLNSVGYPKDASYDIKNTKLLHWPSGFKEYLRMSLTDGDVINNIAKYSGVADNFTITVTFDGIFGIRNLQVFGINNLPKPYVPGNVVFQVSEVDHQIQNGSWRTVVTALVRGIGNKKTKYILV